MPMPISPVIETYSDDDLLSSDNSGIRIYAHDGLAVIPAVSLVLVSASKIVAGSVVVARRRSCSSCCDGA